ncbi:CYTH and CHAD domain-containing protein [Actinokineospora iranica]|nr:CYTH and CHAD domain-containing protein [Actinokineospora iranica]
MTTRVREIERKYEAGADFALPDLTAAGPVSACSGPRRTELDATYFDTADLRLAHAGVTLRRRTGGDDAGWHAKLPVGLDTRDEIRFPLGRARATVPADLAALVRAHTLGAPLAPVVRIATERDEWELKDAEGATIALLADDKVTAHPADGEPRRWRELEIEATDRDVLDAVGAVLGARPSKSTSKLARALGGRAAAVAAPELPKRPTAGDVALSYLRAQVDALRAHDAGVRLDAEDAVHQFRVACRRLRSALRSFRPLLDRERGEALRAELKWLGGEFSPARDTEVLEAELRAELDRVPAEDVLGGVSARLTAELGRAAADARAAALAAVDSDRYLALLTNLDALLAAPPWTDKASRPAARELGKPVVKAWHRLARSVAAVSAAESDRDTALHQARKDAKKLRYTVEAVRPVFGVKLAKWGKKVKKTQSALGTHQDAVVARAALRDLGVRAHLAGDNGFTYGLMRARQDVRALRAEQEFTRRWKRLRKAGGPRGLR